MEPLVRFDVRCASCNEEYHTDTAFVGRSIHCRCGAEFVVEAPVVPNRDLPELTQDGVVEAPLRHSQIDWGTVYEVGCYVTGVLVFVCSWIYCVVAYGFLLGVGLGWLPSLIVAVIAAYLWPLVAVVLVVLIILAVFVLSK